MKYRFFTMLGLLALLAAPLAQAQDYDDIYYDASSAPKQTKTVKVSTPAKTVAVYGEVPERYKVAAQSNYSVERDVDEYNRRGAYEPDYAVTLDGDTIFDTDTLYEESFANTRRIERFYNPDIVILSDDEDLVELYYDESPTINLIVGSDWGYGSYYGFSTSYYPWYSGWYEPWYTGWYSWYTPWHYSWYGPRLWGWPYWSYHPWHTSYWGWNHGWGWGGHYWGHNWGHNWGWNGNHYADWGHRGSGYDRRHVGGTSIGTRAGLAGNRNTRNRVGQGTGTNRSGIAARSGQGNVGSRSTGAGTRGGYASSRGGNMGSRGTSGVTTRSGGTSRQPSSGGYSSGGRSSGGSYSGGRSSGGSYSGGRSSGSSGGSYSGGGSSRGSSGGGGGGGSRGGSSGGGGHRR